MYGGTGVTIPRPGNGLNGTPGMMRSLSEPQVQVAPSDAARTLALKADLCARILLEATRLVRVGQLGAPVKPFVLRAHELLDDMDELRVVLGTAQQGRERAVAASLRRELEKVEAALSTPSGAAAPPANS
jgi:hypothetical protein